MRFASIRTIGGVEVRPGAVIAQLITTHSIFGKQIKAGGRCVEADPDVWVAVVQADNATVWESANTFPSYDAADAAARAHARERLTSAARDLFA